ncbi:MAG: hypothetical protein WBW93_16155 [Steroidobacteraceae bacterium]
MIIPSRARTILTATLAAAATLALLPGAAHADVTVGQRMSMNLAGINIDIDSLERTSGDKQRIDTTTQCHGLLSLFCHDVASGRIVRLDKALEWQLQPGKQLYTERPFPTAEQRAAAQKELEAAMEEMKNCPMPQAQHTSQAAAPDTSHCQLSPPVLSVKATNEHATILGHDAHKSAVVLSQTCTDTRTGDVCEIDYGFETWLTTDAIAGAGERTAFAKKYLAAQGLDPSNRQLQRTLQQFMAPYADELRQLQGKAADLSGYPLRTSFYMAFGGPHCGKAQQAAQQQRAKSGNPFSMHGIASRALASGFSSLFHRGAAAIPADSAGGAAAASAANDAAEPAANAAAGSVTAESSSSSGSPPAAPPDAAALVRVVSLISETTSIDTSSIPSDQFEIPAGWTRQAPQPAAQRGAPKCPTRAP